jgi:ketosteroid isomerase-like protein
VDERENVRTVRRLFARVFGEGDIPGALRLLTDDVDWWLAGPEEILPWAGTRRGREQVGRFLVAFPETLEIQAFEPRTFVAQGDLVVVHGHEVARVKPTDRLCATEWVMVFTLRNGRVARFRQYHDTAAWVAAYQGGARRTRHR